MQTLALPQLEFDRGTLLRGATAGAAWGVIVATALLGLSLYQCGGVCAGQIVETTALSVLGGIVAIGPIAAFRRR